MLLKFLCLFFAGLATGLGSFAGLLYFMFLSDKKCWFFSYACARHLVSWLVIIAAICTIISASCGLIYYYAL